MKPRRRLVSCLQLMWAKRIFTAYFFLALGAAAAYILLDLLAPTYVYLALALELYLFIAALPLALAAAVAGRIQARRVKDDREALLALMQIAHERGAFCVKAELVARAFAYFGISIVVMVLTLRLPFPLSLPLSAGVFVILYSRFVSRMIETIAEELEYVRKLREKYEELGI